MPKAPGARLHTPVADQIRELLRREVANGWTTARITYEMNMRGHDHWTTSAVTRTLNDRQLSVDEAISLLAIFKGNASLVIREVDKIATAIVAGAGKDKDKT